MPLVVTITIFVAEDPLPQTPPTLATPAAILETFVKATSWLVAIVQAGVIWTGVVNLQSLPLYLAVPRTTATGLTIDSDFNPLKV